MNRLRKAVFAAIEERLLDHEEAKAVRLLTEELSITGKLEFQISDIHKIVPNLRDSQYKCIVNLLIKDLKLLDFCFRLYTEDDGAVDLSADEMQDYLNGLSISFGNLTFSPGYIRKNTVVFLIKTNRLLRMNSK